MQDDLVKKCEIENPIKASKFRSHVLQLLDRYSNSSEPKKYFREKLGFVKMIVEEMLPLSILTKFKLIPGDLFIKMYPESGKPYDADIVSAKCELKERFEITMAFDHQESIRMEYLSKYGRVDAFGEIEYEKIKRNRDFNNKKKTEAFSTNQYDKKQLEKVRELFNKKLMKGNKYKNVSLLIGMYCIVQLSDDFWKEIDNTITREKGPFKKYL